MSTFIMGLCWPLQMPPTPKAVLMSIADQANDQAACWPSLRGLCVRTCFGRTAVIEAIKWLVDAGYLSIEKVDGKNNRYTVSLDRLKQRDSEPVRQTDQCAKRTSPEYEPVREPDYTGPADELPPVREADQPVRQADPNRQEPSLKPKKEKEAPVFTVAELVADGLTEQTAKDWLKHRKRKRAELTVTAWEGIKVEAAKAGLTLQGAVAKAILKGWTGFDADWVKPHERTQGSTESFQQRAARERVQQMSPHLAAKAPGAPTQQPFEVIDGSTKLLT